MLEKHQPAVGTGNSPDKLNWSDLGVTCTNHIKRKVILKSTFRNTGIHQSHGTKTSPLVFHGVFFFKVTCTLNISTSWTFCALPMVFVHLIWYELWVTKATFSSELCLTILFMLSVIFDCVSVSKLSNAILQNGRSFNVSRPINFNSCCRVLSPDPQALQWFLHMSV